MPVEFVRTPASRKAYLVFLFLISTLLALVALILPLLESYNSPALAVGQVADRDYRAPRADTFKSEVLTEQRRQAAERAVLPIFTSPDTRVARQQLERLRAALAYISSVRADLYAAPQKKLDDLASMEDIHLSQETAATLITLADPRWQETQQEAIQVLERVMSEVIRQDSLPSVRNNIPALVSLSLPETQAAVVAELVAGFTVPNSQYSESLTLAAQKEARDAVTPVNQSFVPGQTIAARGQVLNEADLEALQKLGLAQPDRNWQDLVSAAALALMMVAFMWLYLRRKSGLFSGDVRNVTLLAVLFLGFLLSARLVIPMHTVIPYAFPVAAYGLTAAALFNPEVALVSSLPLSIMAAFGLPNALDLTVYYAVGSLFGILALGRARRIVTFFWSGVGISISGVVTILVYHLPIPTTDTLGIMALTGAAFVNGLAAASITLLLQSLLAQFLGITTPMQLMDLTRPDHPLLSILLRDAPGTYQHSLQVANLAEQAADRIGADALLTRVGALYHDVGKTLNPVLFIENQPPGFKNPHSGMDPVESASLIIRHVQDGLELGHKYHLPLRILDFIAEHHGTTLTRYQYVNAVKAATGEEGQVQVEKFRYPGPRPQSRETAILMLADSSEACVRAEPPVDEQNLRALIKGLIDNRFSTGQLDDTHLTLRDLNQILESFTIALQSTYHPRVQYPRLETEIPPVENTRPLPKPAAAAVDLEAHSP